ncbi:hypothetical protein PFAG_05845 [Plasmodium falciparum Santa Lucia]|uniref:Uncharacterized protein n=1 Tax=Plasmodium falciparum Santa Lucia TaxID=478859 RepID=W7FYD2_PLAFA|nr:hypothetical protein PFAG_05845 [Plasmodium falciparum Santa Lucia]
MNIQYINKLNIHIVRYHRYLYDVYLEKDIYKFNISYRVIYRYTVFGYNFLNLEYLDIYFFNLFIASIWIYFILICFSQYSYSIWIYFILICFSQIPYQCMHQHICIKIYIEHTYILKFLN